MLNILIPAYKFNSNIENLIDQLALDLPFSTRILFCLNGSYDVNHKIQAYASKLENFHVVHYFWAPKGMPIGYYREYLRVKSLSHRADWNLFLDADDSLELETLKNFKSTLCSVQVYKFNDPGNPYINSAFDIPFSTMVFYDRAVFKTVAFAPLRRMEDQLFNLQVQKLGHSFIQHPETLIHITKDPESITRKPKKVLVSDVLEEALIAQSFYNLLLQHKSAKSLKEFNELADWIQMKDFNALKILTVSRELHKEIPFLDTDTQVLLYAVDNL